MLQAQHKADIILHSGQVISEADHNIREAVAVRGEVIQAVGSDQEVLALAGPGTTIVNFRSHAVIPGMIDAHAHMDREGLKRLCSSLQGAASIADILAIVEQQVA